MERSRQEQHGRYPKRGNFCRDGAAGMSSERVYGLHKKLLGLAENQLKALQEERFDEALEYLEKRQRIIDKIQSRDAIGKNDHEGDDYSHKIRINIEKILSID